jgi:hypothetical protein
MAMATPGCKGGTHSSQPGKGEEGARLPHEGNKTSRVEHSCGGSQIDPRMVPESTRAARGRGEGDEMMTRGGLGACCSHLIVRVAMSSARYSDRLGSSILGHRLTRTHISVSYRHRRAKQQHGQTRKKKKTLATTPCVWLSQSMT